MSAKSIGNAFVKKCIQKALEPAGFQVCKAGAKIVWIPFRVHGKIIYEAGGRPKLRPITQQEDFFSAFDVMGLHRVKQPFTYLFQMTVGDRVNRFRRQQKVMKIKSMLPGLGQSVQVWQRDDDNKQLVNIFKMVKHGDEVNDETWKKVVFDFRSPDYSLIYGAL